MYRDEHKSHRGIELLSVWVTPHVIFENGSWVWMITVRPTTKDKSRWRVIYFMVNQNRMDKLLVFKLFIFRKLNIPGSTISF